MPEILNEWAGYNGKMIEEKKPDGSTKKTKHHKIWAIALTDTGHVYVRYGPAKQPLKLTEQIIRPQRGISEMEALREAERVFHEKVHEKLHHKGYDAIPFGASPHFVPSFSTWRMSDEPEEVVAPVHEVAPPQEESAKLLQKALEDLNHLLLEHVCPRCNMLHPRYLVDIGDGHLHTPETVLSRLRRTVQGTAWLATSCIQKEDSLFHAKTGMLLAVLVDRAAEESPECLFNMSEE